MVEASLSLRELKKAIEEFDKDEKLLNIIVEDKYGREVIIFRGV